jgi:hypothetical protein
MTRRLARLPWLLALVAVPGTASGRPWTSDDILGLTLVSDR